ncbi:regulator of volume decrease after cellular swelling [Nitzschia inconspicua]|uniref:Regulator of volume decrease after cellular swelling n=1 Tax=Nitzschia inconspicua TaxID=303405 RepID=A0A9K3PLG1_9STRA|nr:regulator of volume decrease after cellular swelling [Nitzschia inconspicua]
MMMQLNPDQYPNVVLRGSAAQLSALRQLEGSELQDVFFRERYGDYLYTTANNNNNNTTTIAASGTAVENSYLLLEHSIPVTLRREQPSSTDTDGNGNRNNTTTTTMCLEVTGRVFVTTCQLLFVADDPAQLDSDMAIGASCILLHAMMDDPQMAVYLQLHDNDGDDNHYEGNEQHAETDDDENDDNNGGPTEITLIPSPVHDNEDNEHNDDDDACQRLFKSLCKLVALHPTMGDEDDDDNDYGYDEFESGSGGFGAFHTGNDLIWAPSSFPSINNNTVAGFVDMEDNDVIIEEGAATPDERAAMLNRLDNLLVVRPDLEIQEDQFEDAE